MPNSKPKIYTMLSAGLPVDNLPAVGVALVSATMPSPPTTTAEAVENMMFTQSPVLANRLYIGAILGYTGV